MKRPLSLIVLAAALLLIGCNGGASVLPKLPSTNNPPVNSSPFIKHVILVVQENRSFDNLFYNYPGADTARSGPVRGGGTVPLTPVPLEDGIDVAHNHTSFQAAFDLGALDGWNYEGNAAFVNGAYSSVPAPRANYPYAFVPPAEVQPYWQLASQFTLNDRMFQSNSGSSFVAHQYLIADQSNYMLEVPNGMPWGCDAAPGTTVPVISADGQVRSAVFPCQDYTTLGDELDVKGISWHYYAPAIGNLGYLWSGYDVIRHIRFGADWSTRVVSPETRVLSDIANGTLAQMSWVIPSAPNSDHAISHSNTGPQWVASIVNAVGASRYWNDTAIIILWDDWGGWFDHVRPPVRDVMGDGFRVPMIVVSPYAKHGYISHTTRDFGSVLRFAEDTFGVARLDYDDSIADSLNDCFDFTQAVRPLQPLTTRLRPQYFMTQKRSDQPPDPE